MQQLNQQQSQQNKLQRQSTYNLDGQNSNRLFQRIMIRLKIHKVIKHWKKLSKNSFNRYKRIQQWVNTQKTYIDDLKLIVNQIQKPLLQKQLITQEESKIIFPNMNGIIMLSQMMYSTMKQFLEKWHPYKTEIAPAVIKLSTFFKIYIEYFNNYLKGKQILDKLRKRPEYKSIESGLKMDFDSYLSKPTQRPVKYKLLLTDYQKKLRTDHPDYNNLSKAINIYHQVVQKTNQALQNQKKTRRMIQIEQKFKNILQSSRQWKFQFNCYYDEEQNQCVVYVFSDLILVVLNKRGVRQSLLCKMFLDGNCFVQACQQQVDEKFKRIFISGKQENGYFLFQSIDERNKIFTQLSKLINSLHINQWKRREALSKNFNNRFSSTRISKPYYVEDYYEIFDQVNTLKKKFRVTVTGAFRRENGKNKNQYYVVKLQLPFPQVINQKAFIRFQQFQDLEHLLKQSLDKWALVKDQNRLKIQWKSVNQESKEAYVQWVDIQSKFVQQRMRKIQHFLNFVLRNKQTMKNSNLIFHKLKLFQSLYQFLTDDKNQCVDCHICQNGDIISNFKSYTDEMKERINIKEQRNQQNFCIYRSFHVQNRLSSQTKMNARCTPEQIMLFINSKLGIINPALTNRIIQGEPISLKIYRPRYRDLQNPKNQTRSIQYELKIYKRDTVGNVLQMLKALTKLKSIKDFGLVLVNNDGLYSILHEDEYIMDVIKQNNIKIQETQKKQQQSFSSQFKGFFSKIKSNIQQKFDEVRQKTPNLRIQLRKLYVFTEEIQILPCSDDEIRRKILCDQIFYLFKNKTLNMSHLNIVKFVVCFICIQLNEKLPNLKKSDITKRLLESLFPDTRLYIIIDNFLIQVWKIIQVYQKKSIFKLQIFQNDVISLAVNNQCWTTQFFPIINLLETEYLKLNEKYSIGINWQNFVIIKQNSRIVNRVKIRIDKLKIKFSGFFVVISDEQKQYKFTCDQVILFKSILQKYQTFNKYFLGIDKINGRPLMEETI